MAVWFCWRVLGIMAGSAFSEEALPHAFFGPNTAEGGVVKEGVCARP